MIDLPNDKQALLDAENYEIYNRDLMRLVFPRIIAEMQAHTPRGKHSDVITFYYALLSYIDGNKWRKDGTLNDRYGYSFPSQERLYAMTGITEKRQRKIAQILMANGLLTERRKVCVNMKHYVWYRVSFAAFVDAEGYVVSADGERRVPDYRGIL
ncbi:hypothetical protein JCM19037_1577 [Geomicrobium sp. JCM 19037]|uniref:hypothetical protein n=1 Tax=Geomicrobium sp. JCM 19037 TaxID=1460634 RepID=UPI00045F144B|nr:hypothetical protein [Geomicrobium sp. JCM 19037]GAK03269.1 hypothetical protein JCM19037_1577 [Geomicrobium sp. JCM 19037]